MNVQSLVDDAAFVHADAALALHDAAGEREPTLDLAAGHAHYETLSGRRTFGVQVLGIEHPAPGTTQAGAASAGAADADETVATLGTTAGGTWQWAWDVPGFAPEPLLALTTFVRETAERYNLAELAAPRVELTEYSATHLVVAAKTIVGRIASIAVPGPDGSRVHLILDLQGATPGARHASAAITQALSSGLVADQHRALRSYAEIARLRLDEVDTSHSVLATPDGRLEITFDDEGRIERVATRGADDPLPHPPAAVNAPPEPRAHAVPDAAGGQIMPDALGGQGAHAQPSGPDVMNDATRVINIVPKRPPAQASALDQIEAPPWILEAAEPEAQAAPVTPPAPPVAVFRFIEPGDMPRLPRPGAPRSAPGNTLPPRAQ